MRYYLFLASLLALPLTACGNEPISIQVSPAVLAADPQAALQPGWALIKYSGDQHSAAGAYHVREEPLFTEFNIIAFRVAASQPDGRRAVVVRLNEYATRKMKKYSSDPANLKKPLGLSINGHWANFAPLLEETQNRMTLWGFTQGEVEQLEHYMKNK